MGRTRPKRRGERKALERRIGTTLRAAWERRGRQPAMRDLAATVGVAHPEISNLFNGKRGLDLAKILALARELGVPEEEALGIRAASVRVPVLGQITAGPLVLTEAQADGFVEVPRSLLPAGEVFALRVAGDSMEGAAILDQDLAIIRATPRARAGDIVAATLPGRGTALRRLVEQRDDEQLARYLRPENPKYVQDRVGDDGVFVHGVVVLVLRELEVKVGK